MMRIESAAGAVAAEESACGDLTDDVSAEKLERLTAAMERILAGKPMVVMRGQTGVIHLALEAGVSRATANRAKRLLCTFAARKEKAIEREEPGMAVAVIERKKQEIVELREKFRLRVRAHRERVGRMAQRINALERVLDRERQEAALVLAELARLRDVIPLDVHRRRGGESGPRDG